METKAYWNTMDKSTWGDGPWQTEADKIQWPDKDTGLPCLIVRNYFGALCGYVGVTEGHPLYGITYNQDRPNAPETYLEVHGGITFSAFCVEDADESKHIGHIPGEGEPHKVWWFGFDCAHCDDVVPGMRSRFYDDPAMFEGQRWQYEVYRTVEYVQNECASLAKQLQEYVE